MKKRAARVLITACFALCFGTVAYAGSSTVIFNGSGGSILIVTSAPGIRLDNFEVTGGGDFSAKQQLRTSSPTVIVREGEFSGGGSIGVITYATNPEAKFGAYLASDETGYLREQVTHGSSVEFMAEARGSGKGTLEILSTSLEGLDFNFDLIFDYSTMSVLASAQAFDLSWVTSFDQSVQVSGITQTQ